MKSKVIILIIGIGLVFTVSLLPACTRTSDDISKNDALKEKVFNQILNNNDLFNEFMNRMMQSSQSMGWMMNNQNMMKWLFSDSSLNSFMHHGNMSYGMMQNMMNVIHSDSLLSNQWQTMMNNSSHMQHMMMH